jgi:hypothetical protein
MTLTSTAALLADARWLSLILLTGTVSSQVTVRNNSTSSANVGAPSWRKAIGGVQGVSVLCR